MGGVSNPSTPAGGMVSGDAAGTTTALEFNTGPKAKREIRKLFTKSDDPLETIQTFQKTHSLHSMMANAFGTTSRYDKESESNAKKTRSAKKLATAAAAVEDGGVDGSTSAINYESFHPEPVLTFLHHLNVPLHEVHRRIMEHVRSNLLEEIEKRTLPSGREALLYLLKQSWGVAAASSSSSSSSAELVLRPVLVAVLKKLEEEVPPSLLITMAERDPKTKELKYEDLLKEIPLKMRRLIWEADVVDKASKLASASGEGGANTTPSSEDEPTLLQSMIDPLIDNYASGNALLSKAADLTFPTTIAERRVNTSQLRRQPSKATVAGMAASASASATATTSSTTPGTSTSASNKAATASGTTFSLKKMTTTGSSTAGTSGTPSTKHGAAQGETGSGDGATTSTTSPQSTPGDSLVQIREIIGNRPKLLSAVMNLLVARHGTTALSSSDKKKSSKGSSSGGGGTHYSLLGGERFLHCSLLADLLITYGHLPKAYEHIGILCRVVDESVKLGILKDDHLSQIQACLKLIFQTAEAENNLQNQDAAVAASSASVEQGSGSQQSSPASAKKNESSNSKSLPTNASTAASLPSSYVPKDVEFMKDTLVKLISNAITSLKSNDPQSLFMNPVTDDIAPGYSQLIKEPMCIAMMEGKVSKRQYTDVSQFERDVKLMFQNCIQYNIGKDGTWFRTEAKRQYKLFKEPIMKKVKELYKREMTQRRKVLESRRMAAAAKTTSSSNADKDGSSSTKKKRKSPLDAVLGTTNKASAGSAGSGAATGSGTTSSAPQLKGPVINQLTGQDMNPLPFIKSSKSKRIISKKNIIPISTDSVSMPAMACMLLADPFLVRLLLHRLLRALREDMLPPKRKLPCGLLVIPSILQILNLAQLSSQICAIHGRKFIVPDPGFIPQGGGGGKGEEEGGDNEMAVGYASLRKYTPLLVNLLVEVSLDRRVALGGDLHHAAEQVNALRKETSTGTLALPPPSGGDDDDHEHDTSPWTEASSMSAIRACVQGCWVHLLQQGNSNEAALQIQYPKFVYIVEQLTQDTPSDLLINDKPFYVSVIHALLKFKGRLSRSTRDLVTSNWLRWLGPLPEGGGKRKRSMSSALHEMFITLLNEWSKFGSSIMPKSLLYTLSKEAAMNVQKCEKSPNDTAFASAWKANKPNFLPIKRQYEILLQTLPEERAKEWKQELQIVVAVDEKDEVDKNISP